MEFLASDALQGRGSGSHDELLAATYLASQLRQIGIEPAGDGGGYLQNVSGEFSFFREGKKQWNTRNVIGVLHGNDAKLKDEVVLLTAHLDHIGIREAGNGDNIFNGADDDASGCVAVLQLARALAQKPAPRRTVLFVFFGSEESGGQGNQYFLQHPPVPLKNIVANLEFEMIGRPDSAVKPDELWLTGYDRSNLGPELAKHGAKLVADPHPRQNFFQRSDNFALARQGVVAQTVSSFGLHPDYHRPSDDVTHIDFAHMEQAIHSMVGPVEWLANSDFKPEWVEGKKP
jgi:Zn-dependent M28 family amino/carboxypeptidase